MPAARVRRVAKAEEGHRGQSEVLSTQRLVYLWSCSSLAVPADSLEFTGGATLLPRGER